MRTMHDIKKDHDGELKSEVEAALENMRVFVDALLEKFEAHASRPRAEAFMEEAFVLQSSLHGAVFVGHINTDLDSVAGAIGAAALFDGIACIAEPEEKLNGEIQFALKKAGMDYPDYFGELMGAGVPDEDGESMLVCLVDHNEPNQMHEALRNDPHRSTRIAGLIDHHAVSKNFSSSLPLFIDVRPWGSMSTIVAHMFIRANHQIPTDIAYMLLMAILSDTLSLRSVTATPADQFAVALLSRIVQVDDPNELASQMFRAKTDWIVGLGPYEMVRGDQKDFEGANGWKFGIAVLEVTVIEPVLAQAQCIIAELRCLKHEKGTVFEQPKANSKRTSVWGEPQHDQRKELDFAYLFIVDVVKQESHLIICGGRELALAQKAFSNGVLDAAHPDMEAPGKHIKVGETLMHVGNLVSRKAEFAPAFFEALKDFTCHKKPMSSLTEAMPDLGDAAQVEDHKIRRASRASISHDSVKMQRDYDAIFDALAMPTAIPRTQSMKGSRSAGVSAMNLDAVLEATAEEDETAEGDVKP